MPDIQKVVETKGKIITTIEQKGPTYPAKIAREAGLSPLFTAAFLSELVRERKLKISNMKVGSSPIYYMVGQESQLENFSEYLNHKEKEAFEKLKNDEVLNDEEQEPAIRVALRKIKDFAIPINVRIDGETKLFWRYFQFPEERTRDKIRQVISPSTRRQETREEPKENPKPIEKEPEKVQKEEKDNKKEKVEGKEEPKKVEKKPQTSEFGESVKDYLAAKDIEILEELSTKKKEFVAKIRTDTLFGKQEYFLTAKDKKKVNQDDLTIATQKANAERMPALFLTPGQLDKKAISYLEEWKNMIKFEKIRI